MRSLDSPTLAALAAKTLILRHFFWITPRDLITGDQVTPSGFWNDVGSYTLNVVDGVSGSTVSRTYEGSGTSVDFSNIVMAVGLGVRTSQVRLNMSDPTINNLVRGYNLRKAPIERHIGLFDPSSRLVVSTLYPIEVGMVNKATIATASIGSSGGVTLEIVSDTRKLTKQSGDKRSDENQQKRASGDRFFKDAEVMGNREMFWGQAKSTVANSTAAGGPRSGGGILGLVPRR